MLNLKQQQSFFFRELRILLRHRFLLIFNAVDADIFSEMITQFNTNLGQRQQTLVEIDLSYREVLGAIKLAHAEELTKMQLAYEKRLRLKDVLIEDQPNNF